MVAANPLFRGSWTIKKLQATVVNDIWPEVLFFSLVATSKSTPILFSGLSNMLALSGVLSDGENPS